MFFFLLLLAVSSSACTTNANCTAVPHGNVTCVDGTCLVVCHMDYIECSGACFDPLTDRHHCGGCSGECDNWPLSGNIDHFECDNGQGCRSVCKTGFSSCDESFECEINTANDPLHCGDCNPVVAPCPHGCRNSTCYTPNCTCGDGYADCDGDGTCETQLGTVEHCRYCNHTCSTNHVTPHCITLDNSYRTCDYSNCTAGFGNCAEPFDADYGVYRGCEQDLFSYPLCGTCLPKNCGGLPCHCAPYW